ncbi:hypothetical protein [Pseudidiomarina sediminum]|uniref:hypothetical protein n=1 Tax=Pseudidiomarina sediminum TaxID=431675 RepID=UPI001C93BE28|nr:hypothetical protein [Pseudidiomarina sediminum]MBY6062775.1 hypothetical protein [Pseudidiomarina sediminum]
MKQHPVHDKQLSPVEQQLKAQLEANTAVTQPLSWQQLSDTLPQPLATHKKPWGWFGLSSLAVAAAAAWLVVIQPSPAPLNPAMEATQPMLLAGNYTLDYVDQKLQQAYLHDADQAHIDALWQQRKLLTVQEDAS